MKVKLLILFFLSSISLMAQSGRIKGKVSTRDGQPAVYVNVSLKNVSKGTNTDSHGNFDLRKVEAGNYTLIVSFIGLETKELPVTVSANETITLPDIILNETSQQLNEVVIQGEKENKFAHPESEYVSKMPLKNLENPQVYTSITKELLTDQLAFSVDDAIKNAPGITKVWDATGRSGDGGGYYNSRGFLLQSQLRNGIAGNVSSKIDAANLERIEVIKGPSATLFGSTLTSYGGLVNRVTKKPYNKLGGEITYAAGSYGFNRISADFNTPLDTEKNILLRVNTAYQYEGSFQDNGFNRRYAFAPSISYRVDDKLSFLFDAEFYSGQNTGLNVFFFPSGQTIASLGATRADQLNLDYKRSYVSDDLYQTSRNTNFFGQMDYVISDQWHSQTNFTITNSFSDGPSPYFYLLSNAAVTGDPTDTGNGYISRNDQFTDNSTDQVIEIQQNFMGDFTIGNLKNRFVGGLDFFYRKSDQFFSGGTYDTIYAIGNIPTYGAFNRTNMDALYMMNKQDFVYPMDFVTHTYSAYVSDVINLTDKLLLLAAVRIDHFDNKGSFDKATGTIIEGTAYSQTALSPKAGIVYQAVKDKVSLFANYQNGFTNKTGTDYARKTFRPEQANQVEGGVKLDILEGKLSSTISYYDIKVTDVVRAYVPSDGAIDPANPNPRIQDGTQVSKGFEAEVIANPFQGMNIVAGFAYNDSKYEKANADVEGRRPDTGGSPYVANLWLSYRLPDTAVKGLGIGFGGNYASDNKVINSASIGVFTLPSYTVLGASLFYDQSKFRVGLKLDNLTNKKYWIGYTTVNPQELRSFTGSFALKF